LGTFEIEAEVLTNIFQWLVQSKLLTDTRLALVLFSLLSFLKKEK
jgi:hypothetical protein